LIAQKLTHRLPDRCFSGVENVGSELLTKHKICLFYHHFLEKGVGVNLAVPALVCFLSLLMTVQLPTNGYEERCEKQMSTLLLVRTYRIGGNNERKEINEEIHHQKEWRKEEERQVTEGCSSASSP